MPKNNFSVLATYTEDILVNKGGKVLASQPGGPALFIKDALRDEKIDCEDFERDRLTVKILLTDTGEYGKIPKKPLVTKANSVPLADWAVVSTVLDEWDILCLEKFPSNLFLDLQGYVRNGKVFGKKKAWQDIDKIYNKIFCIKGTKKEVLCLPKKIVDSQKANRMLVVTDGPKGIDIFYKGSIYHIPVEPLTGLKDTIGAGDTFLGYFAAYLYKGFDVEKAGKHATNKTRMFLLGKTDKY